MTYFYRRKPEKGAIPPKGEEKRRELLLSTVPRSHQSQERDARHDAQHGVSGANALDGVVVRHDFSLDSNLC